MGPTLYKVNATSRRPFFLVLGENYDGNWAATSNIGTLLHLPANWANGFYVNTTSVASVTITHGVQPFWDIAVVTTSLSWIILIGAIILPPLVMILLRWARRFRDSWPPVIGLWQQFKRFGTRVHERVSIAIYRRDEFKGPTAGF
jgi:hypothetical protein